MSDSDMLKLAAKAGGIGPVYCYEKRRNCLRIGSRESYSVWKPLNDDDDALRLAVLLNIPVIPYDDETSTGTAGVVAKKWGSKGENIRRAIVRAAAEIGRSMP